ncbi:MAG: hypothetical protein ACE5HG_02310 [Candidatus Bathyarchaeia archaeon]
MEKPWGKPFKDREEARKLFDQMGLFGTIFWFLGIIFAVLGVISDAVNITLVLEPMSWLLLSIVVVLASIPYWITLAVAMHLLGIEGESKKKE